MAGSLNGRIDRGYIARDSVSRLRRYQCNLQYIFDKYEKVDEDDDTEIDLCDLSIHRGRSKLIHKKTKSFGHSKLRNTPREGDLYTREHAHKGINPFSHRQNQERESFQQQSPDLHGTYVVSKKEDPWNSHGNVWPLLSDDEVDSMGSQQSTEEDQMEGDPYPDDISRIESLNETYREVLSQFGPDLDEDISDAETLITTSESEDSSDDDISEPSSSSEEVQLCKTRERMRVHNNNVQQSPRMESYFASSENSSGYHSFDLPSCVYDRNGIHKHYRSPEPQITYKQVQNHLMSGDKGLVLVKKPDNRHQIQNLYQMRGRGDMKKSKGNLVNLHKRGDTQTTQTRNLEYERIPSQKKDLIYKSGNVFSPKRDSYAKSHQEHERILIQDMEMKTGNENSNNNPSDLFIRSGSMQKGQQTVYGSLRTSAQTEDSNRRNSLCLEEYELLKDMSQNMIKNEIPEYSKLQVLKEGTPQLDNLPMSSTEKVAKWMMPPQEYEDKYQVKNNRKLVIHPVSEVQSYCNSNELSSSLADSERKWGITEENLPHFDQMRNGQENESERNQDGNSLSCNDINCSCRKKIACSCADCVNIGDIKLCQQLGGSYQSESNENNLLDDEDLSGVSQKSVFSLSPEKPSSTFPFPVNQHLPITSTDVTAYPSSPQSTFFSSPRARSKCFESPRAQSYPSSPQKRRLIPDVSYSPSSSLARLHISSPRSSPRTSRNIQRNFNVENNSICHKSSQSVPPMLKVPNGFPYQKSPSTRRSMQMSYGLGTNDRESHYDMRGHIRSSSCDSLLEHRRGSASNYVMKLNNHARNFQHHISEDVFRPCSNHEYQQDKMEVCVPSMQRQDWRHDNVGQNYYEQELTTSRQDSQRSTQVHEPSRHKFQPCRQVLEKSRQVLQPSHQVNEPSRQELQISRHIHLPSRQEHQQSSSHKLQSVREGKPKCSLFPPENQEFKKSAFFQKSFSEKKNNCKEEVKQWKRDVRQSSKNQERCVLQSTPRKRYNFSDPSVPRPVAHSYPRSQQTETRWIQPDQPMTLPPSGHNIRNSRNEDAVIAAAALMHYGGHHHMHGFGPRLYNPMEGDYGLM